MKRFVVIGILIIFSTMFFPQGVGNIAIAQNKNNVKKEKKIIKKMPKAKKTIKTKPKSDFKKHKKEKKKKKK